MELPEDPEDRGSWPLKPEAEVHVKLTIRSSTVWGRMWPHKWPVELSLVLELTGQEPGMLLQKGTGGTPVWCLLHPWARPRSEVESWRPSEEDSSGIVRGLLPTRHLTPGVKEPYGQG